MRALRWTRTTRWLAVAAGVAALVATPVVVNAWPAPDSDVSASDLLALAVGSDDVQFSGYAESSGALGLPIADDFDNVADLFGGRTTMRVWWRDSQDWRIDSIGVTGETDIYRHADHLTTWDYEHNRATRTPIPRIRLPLSVDVLPPVLARRMLDGVTADEVTRISARRVAGIDAPGIRVTPASDASSIDHVDVWIDPESGLPLAIEIVGDGQTQPAIQTSFHDLDIGAQSSSATHLALSPTAEFRVSDPIIDIAAAANRYAPMRPPNMLAGLSRQDVGTGAVGVYGSGPTVLVAMPLWYKVSDPLSDQLLKTPGAVQSTAGISLSVSPLNLLLAPEREDSRWLVAGTVTQKTLVRAARQLAPIPSRIRVFGG